MRALLVASLQKRIEARLLLQHVRRCGMCRFGLQGEVQALVPAILFGMARRDALERDPQPQPPHGELAQAVQSMRGGERHAVVDPDRVRQPVVLKPAFEDAEGVPLLAREDG